MQPILRCAAIAHHAPHPYVSNQVQREIKDVRYCRRNLVERSADRKEGAAHLTWSSQSCMMRRLLSLVSPEKHSLRGALTIVRQNHVTFAILHSQVPGVLDRSEVCQHSARASQADVTLQVAVLAAALLAGSAEGACYAIMASTPDDNFHYQAIMQTLGTCQPSSVK